MTTSGTRHAFVLPPLAGPLLVLILLAGPAATSAFAHGGGGFRDPPPAHRLVGSVVDVEGAPIPSASVRCIDSLSPPWSLAPGEPDGTFTVQVESGPQRLLVSAGGHQPHLTPWLLVDKDGPGDLGPITLRRGKSISGRVVAAAAYPHEAVRLRLLPEVDPVPEEWAEIHSRMRRGGARVSEDGRFHFEGLADGSYRVMVDVCAERRAVQMLQVAAGTADLAIVLPQDMTPQEVTLDLDVRTPEGERLEGYCYSFLDRGHYEARWRSVARGDALPTRVGLPPFRLLVKPPGKTLLATTVDEFVPTAAPYVVRLSPTRREDPAKTGSRTRPDDGDQTLAGIVTRPDGTVVIRARVSAERVPGAAEPEEAPTTARARTGMDGRFALTDLPPGTYRLTAETAGLSSEPYLFQADAGDEDVAIVARERPLDH